MSILIVFLYALVVVVALLLIGIVLIQPAKSGGMGASFGGIGESVFGGKAGSHLTKATVVMTTLFFVLTLLLAALIGRGHWKSGGSGAAVRRTLTESVPAKVKDAPVSKPAPVQAPEAVKSAPAAPVQAPAAPKADKPAKK